MQQMRAISIIVLSASVAGCATTASTTASGSVDPMTVSSRRVTLRESMRKLWAEHVNWTRDYIIAATTDHPSAQTIAARLLRNQEEIGNAIAPYYGSAAGARLTDLLKQHILIAVDLVSAAKAGDNAKQTDADKRWHDNAAEIATFLSGANPNWQRQALLDMLNQHLSLTTQEAVARLQQRWTDDVASFDRIFEQAMMMADALSDGIAKQFPNRV